MSLSATMISVTYGGDTRVLDEVSVRVDTNEWLGLLGPNGAGKSSLLKAIAGLVPATGSVLLDGKDPAELGRKAVAQRVAYVPQEPLMPPGMTVTEYILLGRTPHLPYLGSEGREDLLAAYAALELLDLIGFAGRALDDLSGGERQRVVLARALAQEPSILLLDEPTSALDIGHRQQALELIGAIRHDRPMTIITAMHDLTLAGQFADRLVLLFEGRIVADGNARDVLTAENVRSFYGATVHIIPIAGGGVAVVPVRRLPALQ